MQNFWFLQKGLQKSKGWAILSKLLPKNSMQVYVLFNIHFAANVL